MTKPDYRKPNPGRPDATPETLAKLRAWLKQNGYTTLAQLGDLALLDMVGNAEIEDGSVSLSKLADIPTSRLLGRSSGGDGNPEILTGAQAALIVQASIDHTTILNRGTNTHAQLDSHLANATIHAEIVTKILGSTHSVASTTGTKVGDLDVALVAGTYVFTYYLMCQTTNTGVGLSLGVNYTGTVANLIAVRRYPSSSVLTPNGLMTHFHTTLTGGIISHNTRHLTSTTAPNLGPNEGAQFANQDCLNVIEGIIEVSDSGDLELWHSSESASTTTVEAGSSLILTRTG